MEVEDGTVIHKGLGHTVGQSIGVFYAEDSIIVSRDPV